MIYQVLVRLWNKILFLQVRMTHDKESQYIFFQLAHL